MNTKTVIICILLFLASASLAQPHHAWIHYYGSEGRDGFFDIYVLDGGGYIMCGRSDEEGDEGSWTHPIVWIVKVDHAGNVVWENSYDLFDGDVWSSGHSIIETDNGDFVVGGNTSVGLFSQRKFIAIKVSSDGDLIWERQYGGDLLGACGAVIETKSGHYLLGGRLTPEDGRSDYYAVMVDDDGDIIWEMTYGEHDEFDAIHGIREGANDEFLLGGNLNRTAALLKIDNEGDVIWEQTYQRGVQSNCSSLVSTPNGYALGGYYGYYIEHNNFNYFNTRFRLIQVNGDGQIRLDDDYLWDGGWNQDNSSINCITLMNDGGFTLVGYRDPDNGLAIRTDPGGDISWTTDEFPGPVMGVVEDRDGNSLICGFSGYYRQGTLIKFYPERSAPMILEHEPIDLEFTVLPGDTITFIVHAEDAQEDSIRYLWALNGENVSTDTTTTIAFAELGTDTVQCTVSDGELADSIQWIVNIKELYIDAYTPDSLNVAVHRNTTVDFSVVTRATDGDPVDYQWVIDNEIIPDEVADNLSLTFEQGRNHEVEVIAYRGELWDNVIWQVTMMNMIVDFWPLQFEFEATVDTMMEFMIEPFDPQDNSLNIIWTMNGDSIDHRSWTFIDFDAVGLQQVTVYVSDSIEVDSMTWDIRVNPNLIESPNLILLPDIPTLYPPSPNPFNSQTTIRYALPASGQVRLELFDINGRLVTELVNQQQIAGWHDVVVDGSELVSGMYLVRMTTRQQTQTQRVLLLR